MSRKFFFQIVFSLSFCFQHFALSQTVDSKTEKLFMDLKQICNNFADSMVTHSFTGSDSHWQLCTIHSFRYTERDKYSVITNMDLVSPPCRFVVASYNGCTYHSVTSYMKRSTLQTIAKTNHEASNYPYQTLEYDGKTHFIYFTGINILFNHNLDNSCNPPMGPWTCNEDGTSKPDF